MTIPVVNTPPESRTPYVSLNWRAKSSTCQVGTASSASSPLQSRQMAASLSWLVVAIMSDPPGFHWHETAHDIFMVTKGYVKLWVGDKCRILAPGDLPTRRRKSSIIPSGLGLTPSRSVLLPPATGLTSSAFRAFHSMAYYSQRTRR
ncbi:hypothetical protein Ddc_22352 [Ditylenchus destructor]|nr:hypothetical protein Ddc_22352 [Ditylenchus destructor]